MCQVFVDNELLGNLRRMDCCKDVVRCQPKSPMKEVHVANFRLSRFEEDRSAFHLKIFNWSSFSLKIVTIIRHLCKCSTVTRNCAQLNFAIDISYSLNVEFYPTILLLIPVLCKCKSKSNFIGSITPYQLLKSQESKRSIYSCWK